MKFKAKHLLNTVVGFCKGYDSAVLSYWWNGHTWVVMQQNQQLKNSKRIA